MGAVRATADWVGYGGETFAAPAFHLDDLLKAEPFTFDGYIELQAVGGVGSQNIRHGAFATNSRMPGSRFGILFDETARLHISSSMKITVIIFTCFTSRIFHKLISSWGQNSYVVFREFAFSTVRNNCFHKQRLPCSVYACFHTTTIAIMYRQTLSCDNNGVPMFCSGMGGLVNQIRNRVQNITGGTGGGPNRLFGEQIGGKLGQPADKSSRATTLDEDAPRPTESTDQHLTGG